MNANINREDAMGWRAYAVFVAGYIAVIVACAGFAYAMLYPVLTLLAH